MHDEIKAPAHYAGDGEVDAKRAMESMLSNTDVSAIQAVWWGLALKYLWRWPLKSKTEEGMVRDIDKCIETLRNLREEVCGDRGE